MFHILNSAYTKCAFTLVFDWKYLQKMFIFPKKKKHIQQNEKLQQLTITKKSEWTNDQMIDQHANQSIWIEIEHSAKVHGLI